MGQQPVFQCGRNLFFNGRNERGIKIIIHVLSYYYWCLHDEMQRFEELLVASLDLRSDHLCLLTPAFGVTIFACLTRLLLE